MDSLKLGSGPTRDVLVDRFQRMVDGRHLSAAPLHQPPAPPAAPVSAPVGLTRWSDLASRPWPERICRSSSPPPGARPRGRAGGGRTHPVARRRLARDLDFSASAPDGVSRRLVLRRDPAGTPPSGLRLRGHLLLAAVGRSAVPRGRLVGDDTAALGAQLHPWRTSKARRSPTHPP